MDSKDRAEAAKRLHLFIIATQASKLSEFNACLTMLGNWSKYILNAFECPYTNGYTEGTNNAIKVIKRNAFGYRNFENFRKRIFLALTSKLDQGILLGPTKNSFTPTLDNEPKKEGVAILQHPLANVQKYIRMA